MQIRKETYHDGGGYECDYYTKEYNEKWLLISEDRGGYGRWSHEKYTYNNDDKISKINKTIEDYDSKDKLEITYEYDNVNYRITTILKETRGEEKWHQNDKNLIQSDVR